ncbi:metallophosphoesterase [Paenibacillus senegalensis]|uniref:metallophosphoesterase n=1 Tax=Paenibacillus senegalensis TaxID=1465766 RepID=UPI00028885D3|nr:metallophosphoesterase [Paenibacillus senegalensis]
MNTRWIVIPLLYLLLYSALHYYIGWHGALFMETVLPQVPLWIYWSVFALLAFAYLLARMVKRWIPHFLYVALKAAGSYWMAIFMYAVLLLPIADLAAWALHLGGVPSDRYIPLLGSLVLAAIAILLALGSWNAWKPIIRHYEIAVQKKTKKRKNLVIAVASDLHLGTLVRKSYLQKLVEQMDHIKPDLILLPGDILDDDLEPFIAQNMAETMLELKQKAPLGAYAVLGNHEYYGGKVKEFVEKMAEIGIPVLKDESVLVDDGQLYIVGRKDKAAESSDPERRQTVSALLQDLDKDKPIIVLDHQPHQLEQAAAAGADIMLSGHTHRGQLAPNHWITGRLFELDWGYKQKQTMHAFVSSGYGTWGPPIRIGTRSEIIRLVVHFN